MRLLKLGLLVFLLVFGSQVVTHQSRAVAGYMQGGTPDWQQQATRLENSGDMNAAKELYIKTLKEFERQNNHEGYVKALTSLANLQKNNREFQAALTQVKTADSLYHSWNLNFPILLGDIYHLQGTLQIIFADNEAAINLLQASIKEKRKLLPENDTSLSITYNNLGMAFSNIENFQNAIHYINQAISSLDKKKVNRLGLLAKFHENLGITFARMGDYSKARDFQIRSLYEKRELGAQKTDIQNMALSYVNLGQTETTLGNLDSAFNLLNMAESLLLSTKNPEATDIDIVYNHKGNIYSLLGDYEKALIYYNKSLIMLRRKAPASKRIKEIEMNIGHIYYMKQEFKKSVEYYMASIDNDENSATNIKTFRNLGKSLQALGEINKAAEYFRKAIEISTRKYGENHYEVSASHLHYGNFLNSQEQLSEAAIHYKKALLINTKLFGPKNRDVADCYLRLAELELKRNNPKEGLLNFQNALVALVENFNDKNPNSNPITYSQSPDYYLMNTLAGKGQAFYELYRINHQIKDLYLSYNNYKLYASVANQIRSQFTSEESNLVISSRLRELLGGALRTTTTLYEVTKDNHYLTEAFGFAEKGKSAILLAEVNDREELLGNGTSPQLQHEARKLKNNIAGYKKLIYEEYKATSPNLAKIDLWREKVFELEKQQDALVSKIRTTNPDYLKSRFGERIPSPQELQQSLKDETIIEFTLTNDQLYTFVINPDTFALHTTPVTKDLANIVSEYVDNIRHGLLNDPEESFITFVHDSKELYNLLLSPVSSYINTGRLMIVPDGILGYIPFETLLCTEPSSHTPDYQSLNYLIKHYSVRYSYLASLPFMKWPFRPPAKKTFVGFAPIYSQVTTTNDSLSERPVLQDIPGIRDEVKQIAKNISGSELFLNEKATESTFKKISGDYEILHLALHTLVDNDNPMFSKMIFANMPDNTEDQMLNAYEVYNLELSAKLVVLSSCNTGTGRLVNGEGVMSLARGFLYTGVPSVIMTMWEAEDEAATGLMPNFYRNLENGQTIDMALHSAKLTYLKTADRLRSHPYFWSSYVMIGANEPIDHLKSSPFTWLTATIIAVALLLITMVLLYLKKTR